MRCFALIISTVELPENSYSVSNSHKARMPKSSSIQTSEMYLLAVYSSQSRPELLSETITGAYRRSCHDDSREAAATIPRGLCPLLSQSAARCACEPHLENLQDTRKLQFEQKRQWSKQNGVCLSFIFLSCCHA